MNAVVVLGLRIFFLILLYGFVGWISFIIFKDLQTLFDLKRSQVAPIVLSVIVNQESLEKQYTKSEIILGRDPDCDLTIADETVSLRHCKLYYHHKQWWVRDLESTNGSFINNTFIESPVVVIDGDELKLGKVPITIRFDQQVR